MTDLGEAFGALEASLPAPREHPRTYAEVLLAEPSKAITPVAPSDPARIGYPPTFPIEIALRTSSTKAICEAYGIDRDEWDCIRQEPLFLADLERAVKMVAQEGMSFKLKAALQAEELLKTSWRTIHHADTPPSVRADLIKATMRWAGYDQPPAKEGTGQSGAGFMINFNFKGPNGQQENVQVVSGVLGAHE